MNKNFKGNLTLKNVNFGSGPDNIVPGYIHVDENLDLKKHYYNNVGLMKINILKNFPNFKKLKNVYACHFLEHLTASEGITFLKNCFDSMDKNARIRICVPDFDVWYKNLEKENNEFIQLFKTQYLKLHPNDENLNIVVSNSFGMLTTILYGYGHKMIYSHDYLDHILKEIGFRSVERKKWGESNIDSISVLEPDVDTDPIIFRKVESLIVEGIK